MGLEVDFIKLLNNLILKRFSMLLGIEKIRKEISGPCGYQGLMQRSMNQVYHIRILLTHCQKKNIALNRKILADMAVSDNTTFKKVVEIAKD